MHRVVDAESGQSLPDVGKGGSAQVVQPHFVALAVGAHVLRNGCHERIHIGVNGCTVHLRGRVAGMGHHLRLERSMTAHPEESEQDPSQNCTPMPTRLTRARSTRPQPSCPTASPSADTVPGPNEKRSGSAATPVNKGA